MITTTKKFTNPGYLPTFPGALARPLFQGIVDEVVELTNSELDKINAKLFITGTCINASELAGAYTILKIAVSKSIIIFPVLSTSNIIDNTNTTRAITNNAIDITNPAYTILSYYVAGGDIRANLTTGKTYQLF